MGTNKKKGEKVQEQSVPYEEFDRTEIIAGIKYELKPSPTVNHQKLVTQLSKLLYDTCQPNGVILVAPLDVYFDEDNRSQPDVIFITNENSGIIKKARIEGAPDLVAEILSPSTGINDKIRKKEQYETFGIKEYWIVDPVHFTVDQFVLHEGKYKLNAVYGGKDVITSDLFSCVSVDMKELFRDIK
jgi:Uma2 family endonuclease